MGNWMKYRSWIGYFLLILTPFQGVCDCPRKDEHIISGAVYRRRFGGGF
jgi:hypothetical protein